MRRKPRKQAAVTPEYIVAHYDELKERLHDQETKFDNAVLLVAGGAFTVSAAIVATLKQPVASPAVLAISWTAWALCLLLLVLGYLLSVKATCIVLDLIDAGVYEADRLSGGWQAALIPATNKVSFLCLVIGFAAFGVFLFSNIQFGDQNGSKQIARHEGIKADDKEARRQKEGGEEKDKWQPHGVKPAASAAVPQIGDQRERQDKGSAAQ